MGKEKLTLGWASWGKSVRHPSSSECFLTDLWGRNLEAGAVAQGAGSSFPLKAAGLSMVPGPISSK